MQVKDNLFLNALVQIRIKKLLYSYNNNNICNELHHLD